MNILAYILNALAMMITMISILIKGKNMKAILLLNFLSNVTAGISYLVAGTGINGAVSCLFAGAQGLVNYFFDSKGKAVPKWLIAIYAAGFIALNLYFGGINLPCMFAIGATMCFILSLAQKSGKQYRFWALFNNVLWSSYDIFSGAYVGLITHGTMLLVTLVGMILHDVKREKTEEKLN